MKKLIFGIVLLFCVNSYAINGFSIYKMYTQYDTVTHLNLDSNLNRPASWSSLLVDTLDRKFIRFSDLTNGDTTLSSIKVDTIRSNPYIDSTKGNTIHTGTYTVSSTASVDSLKSTKGVNATGGTFSGRVTGSDIQLSDSVKAVYGDFSGVLEVDSLKSIKGINATGGTFSGRITGSDIDVSDTVKGGTGTFSGALTGTTLNTGNGANELYPMNQGVRTTDDVAFDSTRTRVNVVDSIKLGTGSYLKTYVEGSFPCTLKTNDVTVQQVGTAYYTKVGNVMNITFPVLTGISNSSTLSIYCNIPFWPKQQAYSDSFARTSVVVTDNGSNVNAFAAIASNPIINNRVIINIVPAALFTPSGNKGVNPFTLSYITE